MNNTNANSPGYKHTPLGWIPKNWEVDQLSEIATTQAGGTPSTSNASYWGGNIRWMNSGELNLKYVFEVEGRITDEGMKNSSAKLLPKFCVLVGLAGQGKTRGTVAMNMVELCTNQSVAAIIPKETRLTNHFLYYNLDSRYNELRRLSTGDGGRGGLNLGILDSLIMMLPPVSEQRKIASILSKWDDAIQKTQHLIEQLKQRNKGLMQQLMSGTKRLKGFSEKWKDLKLGDVTTKISRRNGELVEARVYSVTNSNGFVLQSEHFEREIAGADLSNYKIIKKHEFAYNPARINVGSIAYFIEEIGIISSLYVCFKTSSHLLDMYLWYLLDLEHTKHKIESLGEGGVRIYLWYDLFAQIKIALPPLDEQEAIMKILVDADNELKLYEVQLANLLKQRTGLMQELLTGKTRVAI